MFNTTTLTRHEQQKAHFCHRKQVAVERRKAAEKENSMNYNTGFLTFSEESTWKARKSSHICVCALIIDKWEVIALEIMGVCRSRSEKNGTGLRKLKSSLGR
ncbi:hypothetical protein CEXT_270751 [Caerostris extrusa]|uniref:Uncharacterized protein n=1 Tax=Caerostris extrusa TaxID=172846 RepID=A0AAV4VUA9_CAEEX|nr:hypothetical protein CEXT_270751 [Caerostris extrusa]